MTAIDAPSSTTTGRTTLAGVNLAAKVVLVLLLLHAVLFPDLPQYVGKGIGWRLGTYPISTLLVPAIWFGRRALGRPMAGTYPHLIDLCVVAPFLIDTAGNTTNLYNSVTWWDDVMHLVTWVPWVMSFGSLLSSLGRLNVGALTVGFGAVTHILWEIAEYLTFVADNPEESKSAYRDTMGDLAMSLSGSLIGGVLVATLLWGLGAPDR